MHAPTTSPRTYIVICVLLILLTGITVGISFLHLSASWHLALGLLIAIGKASLVALFFMHVLHSNRLIWCVIAITIFWAGILFVLTLGDFLTRGSVPFMPGH